MKSLLGFTLIGISLFMLLGFFNANLPGSAGAQFLALIVGVGIPGAVGGALLSQHFGGKKKLAGRREQLKRQTQEAELLRLAGEHDGRLTVVDVVRDLALANSDAEQLLRGVVERGDAEIEITDRGLLVYRFPDVQLLDEKSSSKGVLDA